MNNLPPPPSQEEYSKALSAFEKLHPTIRVELPSAYIFVLIGALQLALRQPQFPRTSRWIVINLIRLIRDGLNEPVLMRTIDLGFDPRYDRDRTQDDHSNT